MYQTVLKETTARQIVQRTMSIINHSVNVMDNRGTIIASGDVSRLCQRHEGAMLALSENRVVEIDDASALLLKGARPGINLPIIFRKNVVGVVGISGRPDEVRDYAKLVGMAAELIIEQAEMLEQSQWDKRYREDLIQLLISPENNLLRINSIATYLGVDITLPRIAIIISLDEQASPQMRELNERLAHLGKESLVAITELNQFVLLQPILKVSSHNISRTLHHIKQKISSEFAVHISVGGYFAGELGLYRSWLSARAMFETANRTASRRRVSIYQDYIFPVLLNDFALTWQAEILSEAWLQLKAADNKAVLCSTLRSYFDHNCDITHTAKHLQIHTNTLRYRLHKISDVTSLDINHLNDVFRLFIGMTLHP